MINGPNLNPSSGSNPSPGGQPPLRKKFNWALFFAGIGALGALIAALGLLVMLAQWLLPFHPVMDSPIKKYLPQDPAPKQEATPPPQPSQPPTSNPEPGAPPPQTQSAPNVPTLPVLPPIKELQPEESPPDYVPKNPTLTVNLPDDPSTKPHIEESTNFNTDLTVTDKPYVVPRNASPKSELYLPKLPSDSLRSFMTGKQIFADVDVDEQGMVTVTQIRCPPKTPSLITAQIARILQTTRWNPAFNSRGDAVKDSLTVVFSWQKRSSRADH